MFVFWVSTKKKRRILIGIARGHAITRQDYKRDTRMRAIKTSNRQVTKRMQVRTRGEKLRAADVMNQIVQKSALDQEPIPAPQISANWPNLRGRIVAEKL